MLLHGGNGYISSLCKFRFQELLWFEYLLGFSKLDKNLTNYVTFLSGIDCCGCAMAVVFFSFLMGNKFFGFKLHMWKFISQVRQNLDEWCEFSVLRWIVLLCECDFCAFLAETYEHLFSDFECR